VQSNAKYLPRQVEDMLQNSRHPLYWQICAHNPTNEDENQEHLGGACDVIGALGSEENYLEDTPHASEDDETQDCLLSEVLEEDPISLQPGMFSEERRLRVLEQNTVLWGMFTFSYSSYSIN
jgi:hypothetical protein